MSDFTDELEKLNKRARLFWYGANIVFYDSKKSLNYFLKDGECGGGGSCGGRNQSSILINMIEKHKIPVLMIKHFIETCKPNLNYYSFQTTALTAAISCKRNDVVRMLVNMPGLDFNKPCRVNHSTEFQPLSQDLTPLMYAIECDNAEAVDILLDCKDIDVNYKNIYGLTALAMTYNKRWQAFEHIINDGGETRELNRTKYLFGDSFYTIHKEYLTGNMPAGELKNRLLEATPYYERLYTYPGIHDSLQYVIQYYRDKDEHGQLTSVGICPIKQFYPYRHGQELYNAVMTDDEATVDRLLSDADIDVNFLATDEHKWQQTALHLAISENRLPIVRKLVQHPRIDVNAFSWANQITDWSERVETRVPFYTPLLTACDGGSLPILNCLLAHPDIQINKIDVLCRKTGLMVAAKHGHTNIVNRLLEIENIDVNSESCKWYINRPIEEPVGHAAYQAEACGHSEIARRILLHKGAARHLYRAVLPEAAVFGDQPTIDLCLELGKRDKRAKFQQAKIAAFFRAIQYGITTVAEMLYEPKRFHTKYYKHKLCEALCVAIHTHILRFLVKTNVDINGHETKCTPLASFMIANDMNKVLFLLEQPAICDTRAIQHYTESRNCISENTGLYLTMLIERKFYTVETLHSAFCNLIVNSDGTEWLTLLSKVPDFDVNRVNKDGLRPIHLAIRHKRLFCLRYLLTFPTIDIRCTWKQVGGKIPFSIKKILQEYICIQRECRGLTEINIFGKFPVIPTDVLGIIRGFLKNMPIPMLEERAYYGQLRAQSSTEGEAD
jgi:ankyrin repeat protein